MSTPKCETEERVYTKDSSIETPPGLTKDSHETISTSCFATYLQPPTLRSIARNRRACSQLFEYKSSSKGSEGPSVREGECKRAPRPVGDLLLARSQSIRWRKRAREAPEPTRSLGLLRYELRGHRNAHFIKTTLIMMGPTTSTWGVQHGRWAPHKGIPLDAGEFN